MDVGRYLSNLKSIDVDKMILDTLKEFEVIFIDANIDQLKHGERSTRERIGKYASKDYAAMKYSENSLAGFGNIDLILTGAFSRGIFIDYKPDRMVFDSKGKIKENGVDLLEQYGDDVLGLSTDSISKNIKDISTVLVDNYYKLVGK